MGISAQIPQRPFPYFTDCINELAFVVPRLRTTAGDSSASLRSVESSDSGQDVAFSQNPSTLLASQQQGKAIATSPMSQPLPPGTPPGSRHSGQDSPSFSKPAMPAPSATQPPTTPSSSSVYMNIDQLAPRPGLSGGGGASTGSEAATSNVSSSSVTMEGYGTYPGLAQKPRSSKGELVPGGVGADTPRRKWHQQDCAAMIVWLEKFEDHVNFPVNVLSKLLHSTHQSGLGSQKPLHAKKSLPVIFIHKMNSGLYQILTKNTKGR